MGAVLPRQVEAGQLRKGDFFEFKGKRCVVIKTSQQINNRKAFAIVEFRETEGGTKHKETIQAGDKVACCVRAPRSKQRAVRFTCWQRARRAKRLQRLAQGLHPLGHDAECARLCSLKSTS